MGGKSLRITFLDVGQGDTALLELPGGSIWMIDCAGLPFVPWGKNAPSTKHLQELPGKQAIVPYLEHRRINHIDLVVLSHPHPDHYMGLGVVAERFPIRQVWVARPHADQPPNYRFSGQLIQLALNGTKIVYPKMTPYHLEQGVTVQVLSPRYETQVASADPTLTINDNSLVLQITYQGRSILLTGDIESEAEELLVQQSNPPLRMPDIVKVPHHGSNTSSTKLFVDATRPRFAVISNGVANRFGFPAADVVHRWENAGTQVLRTDVHGAITLQLGPNGDISVATEIRPFF